MTLAREIKEILTRIVEFLPTLSVAAEEVSELLQQGDVKRGLLGLTELVTGLQELQRGLEFLCQACGAEADGFALSRKRLESVYPLILSAIQAEDLVATSDALSYELLPALQACHTDLGRMQEGYEGDNTDH